MNRRERAGQLAYEAFYAREGLAVTPWNDVADLVQDRWMYAAGAVSSLHFRLCDNSPEDRDYSQS